MFGHPFLVDTLDKILGFASERGGHEYYIRDFVEFWSPWLWRSSQNMGDSFVGLVIDFVYKLFTKIIAFEPYMVLFFK